MAVTVWSPDGGVVNLRRAGSKAAPLVDRIIPGTNAEVLEKGSAWSKIRVAGKTGWMMNEFLVRDEGAVPQASSDDTYSVIISGLDLTQAKAILNNYPNSRLEKEAG